MNEASNLTWIEFPDQLTTKKTCNTYYIKFKIMSKIQSWNRNIRLPLYPENTKGWKCFVRMCSLQTRFFQWFRWQQIEHRFFCRHLASFKLPNFLVLSSLQSFLAVRFASGRELMFSYKATKCFQASIFCKCVSQEINDECKNGLLSQDNDACKLAWSSY